MAPTVVALVSHNQEIQLAHRAGREMYNSISDAFNNTMYNSSIIFVKDLFDQEGSPLNEEKIEELTGKRIMLTNYFAIWKSIPRIWKASLQGKKKIPTTFGPLNIEWLLKDKKRNPFLMENLGPKRHSRHTWSKQMDA